MGWASSVIGYTWIVTKYESRSHSDRLLYRRDAEAEWTHKFAAINAGANGRGTSLLKYSRTQANGLLAMLIGWASMALLHWPSLQLILQKS